MKEALEHQHSQKTILVVDDDPDVLKVVCAMLVDGDYNVLRANNGKEAIQKSDDYKPEIHLPLSDFQMPEMNGVGVAIHISRQRPDLKVRICRNRRRPGFDSVKPDAEDPAHPLPPPPFRRPCDCALCQMVPTVLPHIAGSGRTDG